MNSRPRASVLIALLALALAPAVVVAQDRTVSVTAEATVKVPNDTASLGFSVSREQRTRGAALRAVSNGLRDVIAAVQATPGVGPGDVRTGRISVRKVLRGKGVAFRAGEGIGVTLHQPDKAGELVSTAIGAGATGVNGPNFFVGDSELAFGKALAAAFDRARSKANTLAVEAGATLGPAVSIDEGSGAELVPQGSVKTSPTAGCTTMSPVAKRVSSRCTEAPPPVKPGTSTVTATVHVVFALQ